MTYLPILDVASGRAAGYQAVTRLGAASDDVAASTYRELDRDGTLTARALAVALDRQRTLPGDTFLTLPIASIVAASSAVHKTLLTHAGARGGLRGVVLDIVGFDGSSPIGDLEYVLTQYRDSGALVAVGGHGAAQPELSSIVRLKPAILRLGRDWMRGIDRSETKRSAVEIIGRLAGQLDASILAEGVATAAELRVLAGLAVPLAQGPLVGGAGDGWPPVERDAVEALAAAGGDGAPRSPGAGAPGKGSGA